MKKRWNYFFSGLYGLMVYTCIRLITDSASRMFVFLRRDLWINLLEVVASVLVGYLTYLLIVWYEKSRALNPVTNWEQIFREFAVLGLYTMLLMNSTIGVMAATTDNGMDLHDFIMINLIPLLFVLITYSIRRGNFLIESLISERLKLERVEKDKINTELELLKSQYHPHFLFNSLNTIYFQMDESVVDAKKTVEKLSELLRYQLYEDKEHKVTVGREMEILQAYIDLQKVRHGSVPDLKVTLDARALSTPIYPLLFMPLVENAFKYLGGKRRIALNVNGEAGHQIEFCVSNSVDTRLENTLDLGIAKVGGLGLANLRRRLDLLYPQKYSLETGKAGDEYVAKLKIELSEN